MLLWYDTVHTSYSTLFLKTSVITQAYLKKAVLVLSGFISHDSGQQHTEFSISDQFWEPEIRNFLSFGHAGISSLDGLPLSNLLGAGILLVICVYWSTAYATYIACIRDSDHWCERWHMLVWRAKPSGMPRVLGVNRDIPKGWKVSNYSAVETA